jgi:hypothetical protein
MRPPTIALVALFTAVLPAVPVAANRKLPFGRQDGAPPAMVFVGKLFEGVKVYAPKILYRPMRTRSSARARMPRVC